MTDRSVRLTSRLLKKSVDPVAGARGSVSVIDNTRSPQSRERQRPGPDRFFSSLLERFPCAFLTVTLHNIRP